MPRMLMVQWKKGVINSLLFMALVSLIVPWFYTDKPLLFAPYNYRAPEPPSQSRLLSQGQQHQHWSAMAHHHVAITERAKALQMQHEVPHHADVQWLIDAWPFVEPLLLSVQPCREPRLAYVLMSSTCTQRQSLGEQ